MIDEQSKPWATGPRSDGDDDKPTLEVILFGVRYTIEFVDDLADPYQRGARGMVNHRTREIVILRDGHASLTALCQFVDRATYEVAKNDPRIFQRSHFELLGYDRKGKRCVAHFVEPVA